MTLLALYAKLESTLNDTLYIFLVICDWAWISGILLPFLKFYHLTVGHILFREMSKFGARYFSVV